KFGKEFAASWGNILHGQEVCGMRLKVFPAEPQDSKSPTIGSGGGSGVNPKMSSGVSNVADQQLQTLQDEVDDNHSTLRPECINKHLSGERKFIEWAILQ
ncbi:unnamed protein product, partial [Allacma fusca]